MPRQFNLTNANHETVNLNFVGHAMYEPDGLGWAEETSVVRLGETFLVTENEVARPAVSGEIVFHGYQEYDDFLRFAQAGGLVLGYMPLSTWRYLDCTIQLSKTEIKPFSKLLICPVVFNGTSQWYEAAKYYQASGDVPNNAKIYPYTYDYVYAGVKGGVDISNGALSSYFIARIDGALVNPSWKLYVGGELIKSGRIEATIPSGDYVLVNTDPTEVEIAEYTSGDVFVRDLYKYSDWTTERIFTIPAGESVMVFTEEGGTTPIASIEVHQRV